MKGDKMTAKERAENLMRWVNSPQNHPPLPVLIADEITAAEERGRLQERKACREMEGEMSVEGRPITLDERVSEFVAEFDWCISDADHEDLCELVRRSEERGRVEMRDICHERMSSAIKAAVAEHNEKCAKVIACEKGKWGPREMDPMDYGAHSACDSIEEEIRALLTSPEKVEK